MRTKLFRTILAALLLTSVEGSLFGQVGDNIDIRFLKASFIDTISRKELVAVFLVSTHDTASFPPQVMLPPKCTVFENGREKVVLLTQNMLAVSIDGEDISDKNKVVYNLIKDQINLKSLDHSLIVTYTISNIHYTFKRMSLTPAFREKRNNSMRVEKRCEFTMQ